MSSESELLEATVARIETKLDVFIQTSADHEDRLRHLERGSWMARGILVLGGAAAGFFAKFGVHIG
jgi:hypothetical protein